MKRILAWLLCLSLLLSLAPAVSAAEEGSFVLTAANANSIIIEPEYIPYTQGQTVKEALLASGHEFMGLEQGFIYAIDGVDASFQLFYDGGKYDLDAPASDISALCIGVTSQYSEELLTLISSMAEYRSMGNVQNYPAAQTAYAAGLTAIRRGDGEEARTALDQLQAAIEAYNAQFAGTKYTVSVTATQGDTTLASPTVTLTDGYGNETTVTGTSLEIVAGDYSFRVSDGGYNRTEGKLTVSGTTTLAVTLPSGEWFGDVNILDNDRDGKPYPCTQDTQTHTATFQIPDTARELGTLYLNVYQGTEIPDRDKTKLRTIYTGVNGIDFSTYNRSWESTATVLTYLVEQGMTGTSFPLEAQYVDASGHTQIQSYQMILERVPTLASLTVSADGTILPMDFDPRTYSYDLVTVSDKLEINAQGFGADYSIEGVGKVTTTGSHTVTVSVGDKSTSYQLNITQKDSVSVTVNTAEGVSIQVLNAVGSVIVPVDGVYHLIPGETYRYIATRADNYHTTASFVAAAGLVVEAVTPDASDWLENLALYDSSNASTRITYAMAPAFSSDVHSYTCQVSDYNTTAFLQTTSGKTVTALYRTQTTSPQTNDVEMTKIVNKAVDAASGAQILTQAVARSGYHNTVTLRLSEEKDGVTHYQDYTLTLARVLHLTELSLEQDGEDLLLMDGTGAATVYDRDTTGYTVKVNRDSAGLTLNAAFPNTDTATDCCGGYYALVNGQRYESLEKVNVALNPEEEKETISVQVCHKDESGISQTYQITVEKTDPVSVTISTDPGDAVVFLTNDLNGKRILPQNGTYLLTPGGSYSYTLTAKGYVGQTGSITAPEADGTISLSLTKAPENNTLANLPSEWPHLRQNGNNNGVVDYPMPTVAEDTVLNWATQIGSGFDSNACGCPILVDGYLYTYAGSTIYKVDTISGQIVATGTMDHASSFAINPPTYANGMLFVGLANGTIQAFNAATLESLWIYRDPLGGQPNCSITYHDGYIYTGFWVGETSNASFVCLTATDEDPTATKEEKLATWRYTSKGGFYWAGAYVCDDYLLVGTDDGESGYTTGYSSLLSFDPATGKLLSSYRMPVTGDIRSSITRYNGKYYFTNKGGYFFEATMGSNGTISTVRTMRLYNYASDASTPPMSTCTPTIYNGRAYIGVSGTSQFGAYSGHNITVIDIPHWEIAYTVRTQGYPQTSGVLTTAYESTTGSVYVYFFDNYTPGKLRMLEDKPGQNSPSLVTVESFNDKGTERSYNTVYALFTPSGDQAQYALCSPIVDSYGTIYFKNDSAYLMAVGSTITELEITSQPEKLTYKEGEFFNGDGLKVIAHYANGTNRDVTGCVTWSEEALTANDTDFIITFPYAMYQNKDGQSGVECEKPVVSLQLEIESSSQPDLNGDNKINMDDVSLLLQSLAGSKELTEEQKTLADLNGDNKINMDDVSVLLKILASVITQQGLEE